MTSYCSDCYYYNSVWFGVDNDAIPNFCNKVRVIIKNWESDGSKEITGMRLCEVHVEKEKAEFFCSGFFGKRHIMTVYADGRKTVQYI